MAVVVEIENIYSLGRLAGKDYSLVCRGAPVKQNQILLKAKYQFYGSLISNSSYDWRPVTYDIGLTPLSVRTSILVNVNLETATWNVRMNIDLIKWNFSITNLEKNSHSLPEDLAYLLFASFGIRKKLEAMSFATISSMDVGKSEKETY